MKYIEDLILIYLWCVIRWTEVEMEETNQTVIPADFDKTSQYLTREMLRATMGALAYPESLALKEEACYFYDAASKIIQGNMDKVIAPAGGHKNDPAMPKFGMWEDKLDRRNKHQAIGQLLGCHRSFAGRPHAPIPGIEFVAGDCCCSFV